MRLIRVCKCVRIYSVVEFVSTCWNATNQQYMRCSIEAIGCYRPKTFEQEPINVSP